MLRRSAGLALAFMAILRAEPRWEKLGRCNLFQHTILVGMRQNRLLHAWFFVNSAALFSVVDECFAGFPVCYTEKSFAEALGLSCNRTTTYVIIVSAQEMKIFLNSLGFCKLLASLQGDQPLQFLVYSSPQLFLYLACSLERAETLFTPTCLPLSPNGRRRALSRVSNVFFL